MKKRIFISILGILLFSIINNFISISNYLSKWKTQEILYINKNDKNEKIIFQMKDIGALGYKKRIVKQTKIFFYNKNTLIDTLEIDKRKWTKTNKFVNELNLKLP